MANKRETVGTNETAWQRTMREAAEAHGFTVFQNWKSYNSPAGDPDLRMLKPPRLVIAELKMVKTGKVSTKQAETLALYREIPGVEVYLWWMPADFVLAEQILREPPHTVEVGWGSRCPCDQKKRGEHPRWHHVPLPTERVPI